MEKKKYRCIHADKPACQYVGCPLRLPHELQPGCAVPEICSLTGFEVTRQCVPVEEVNNTIQKLQKALDDAIVERNWACQQRDLAIQERRRQEQGWMACRQELATRTNQANAYGNRCDELVAERDRARTQRDEAIAKLETLKSAVRQALGDEDEF